MLAVASLLLAISYDLTGYPVFSQVASVVILIAVCIFYPTLSWSRRFYIIIGFMLALLALTTRENALQLLAQSVERSLFVATFFIALLSISSVARGTEALVRSGNFIAKQPAGRRYLMLTIGAHLFGLIMHYGAITLLGPIVAQRDERKRLKEPDDTRRMLLAVQRGFISTLPWTPLAFPIVITTTLVPNSSWVNAMILGAYSSLILCGGGWIIDKLHRNSEIKVKSTKPRSNTNRFSWAIQLRPLLQLLGAVFVVVFAVSYMANLAIRISVMISLPAISVVWYLVQFANSQGVMPPLRHKLTMFSLQEVPLAAEELALLIMAPFIGAIGVALLEPMLISNNLHIDMLSPAVLVLLVFWFMPLTGQLGMHPLLSVSMLSALVPNPTLVGVQPDVFVVAITSGWALAAVTSPFTASVFLVAKLACINALRVGLIWNGVYTLVTGVAISIFLFVLVC